MRKIETVNRGDIWDSDDQMVRLIDGREKSWRSICVVGEPAVVKAGVAVEYYETDQTAAAVTATRPEQAGALEA